MSDSSPGTVVCRQYSQGIEMKMGHGPPQPQTCHQSYHLLVYQQTDSGKKIHPFLWHGVLGYYLSSSISSKTSANTNSHPQPNSISRSPSLLVPSWKWPPSRNRPASPPEKIVRTCGNCGEPSHNRCSCKKWSTVLSITASIRRNSFIFLTSSFQSHHTNTHVCLS